MKFCIEFIEANYELYRLLFETTLQINCWILDNVKPRQTHQ